MASHTEFLRITKLKIEKTLRVFFDSQVRKATHPLSKQLMRVVGEYTMRKGAKRARGTLVLLGYLSNTRNKLNADILKIAAAYEILQAYLLIHDDIIDRDIERRGRPTLHKVFEGYAPLSMAKIEREQIGIDIALIVGDLAADLVQRMVLDTNFSDAQKIDALEYFEQTLHTTYVGQVLDILSLPQRIPKMADQYMRYLLKTATYTIEAPFLTGVRMGKAKINQSVFHSFAQDAGLAFQLSNDIQNIYSAGLAGTSSDIREGKITLLVSFALQSVKYRKPLLIMLKKKNKTARDMKRLKKLIVESGGYEKARQEVLVRHERAEKKLSKIGAPPYVFVQFEYLLDMLKKLMEK